MRGALADETSSSLGLAPQPASGTFPLVFEPTPDRGGHLVMLGVLALALAALVAPFWLLLTHLASDPAARALIAERPLLAGQLGAGLVMLIMIFGWPLTRLARLAFTRRRVTITAGAVHSDVVGPFGTFSRTMPLTDYLGLQHRTRTSLSGVRRELVLAHRQPARSLVLGPDLHVPEETLAALARLFAVAEIPSRDTASVELPHGYILAAEPQARLAA
jgi:hypothetical protein